MISGASSRKLPREVGRNLQPAFEQLQLPWLCPRLHSRAQSPARPRLQYRATATAPPRRPSTLLRSQTTPVATRHNGHQERTYAYASSYEAPSGQTDEFYIPLVSDSPGLGRSWGQDFDSRAHQGHQPLIIDDSTLLAPGIDNHDSAYSSRNNPADVFHNLEACLIVGLHERAAATMRRIGKMYSSDNPELLRAHNFYIGHMIGQYNTSQDPNLLKYIQKWYHVDMLSKGVRPDAATYAMMIQMMMRNPDENQGARGIRKYVATAETTGLGDAVIAELRSVMNSRELLRISDAVPNLRHAFSDEVANVDNTLEYFEKVETSPEEDPGIEWEKGLPKIAATNLKGEGLKTLQKSLSSLSASAVTQQDADAAQSSLNHLRQQKLEDDAWYAAVERWRLENEAAKRRGFVSGALQTKPIGAQMWNWHTEFVKLVHEELQIEIGSAVQVPYQPYLRFVPVERLSALTIVATMNQYATCRDEDRVTVTRVCNAIGNFVEQESMKEWVKIRKRNRFALNTQAKEEIDSSTTQSSPSGPSANPRKIRARPENLPLTLEAPEWSPVTRVKVGAALLSLLLRAATIANPSSMETSAGPSSRPALMHSSEFRNGKRLGVVRLDPELLRYLRSSEGPNVNAKHLPMLVEPVPWSGVKTGAYLAGGVKAVRMPVTTFQSDQYTKLAIENGDMKQILAGLDVLGKVPWQINRRIFDIFLSVWNTGDEFLTIPPVDPVVDFPEAPSESASFDEKKAYRREKQALQNKLSGWHSERAFMNFQLEVARAFQDEAFYLPHNMDFRGRAYPIPPYLNQMGADHARALLLFAKGKELGERGLEWLKIHLANVYGFDKASLSERREFAEENLEQIFDSANRPLDGKKWWTKAEDPWQCLATCFELRDALNSPDPTKFISHLPVHQDGTCNGLQHYAALGGDEAGAKQVNLEPGDRPSDIYTAVSDLVREYVVADAAEGFQLAKLLQDKIVRKVVKQTVMTNVYGVTFQGARLQVQARLEELYPEVFGKDIYVKFMASSYLAKHIFKALGTIFNGASAIQQWLGDCASQICESLTPEQMALLEELQERQTSDQEPTEKGKTTRKTKIDALAEHAQFKSTIIWTTPLRMPVVQPYRAHSSQSVTTNLQHLSIVKPSSSDRVLKRKQLQAFPPNFIHSLDATHMILSALKCDELGMSFAAVHDSFWTHAADIDKMSTVIRDAFVRMHEEDVIGRLSAEFNARYKDNMYMASIPRRSPLGKKLQALRKAKGFRAATEGRDKITELLEERTRQRLLASEDPELCRQGKEMVTPASLYSEMKDETEILHPDNMVAELADGAADELDATATLDEVDMAEQLEPDAGGPIAAAAAAAPNSDPTIADPKSKSADRAEGFSKTAKSREEFLRENMSEEALKIRKELNARQPTKSKSNNKYGNKVKTWVWLPLTIPPVPQKGSWDVSRLTKSKYFFS